jgi:glycosyltransferase involved in cell wall biosynthesis
MKILCLSPVYPIPVDNGAKRRMMGFLDYFGPRHQVTLASPASGESLQNNEKSWTNLEFQDRRSSPAPALLAVLSPFTYREVKFWFPGLQAEIHRHLQDHQYDVIWVNFLNMLRYLEGSKALKDRQGLIILDQHNVDSGFWSSFITNTRNPLVRLFASTEYNKALRRQRLWYPRCDAICSVSDEDREATRSYLGTGQPECWLVPNGVDAISFAPPAADKRSDSRKNVVFMGSMDAFMNQEAAIWFARKVWPQVRQEHPAASFIIVGRDPAQRIRQLSDVPGVVVTGSVPDVKPYLEKADVFVNPVQLGGGTKLKTLEAMAMGLPIVSTPSGIQGLPVVGGEQLMIANGPEEFSDAVKLLLQDRERALQLGIRSRRFVETTYNWNKIYRQVEQDIEHILKS